ncbi:hypothetical protein EJC49_09245 [Aquibium carbonis]|uniref:PH domain-containing protein n=1 Tax=Aquibium carbonis TaxID=2495581 RepID=A0A3S0A9G3_9HYPH|nr:hypothetical protein [Aquibium carbonis]RST86649.1 hypothetical protein EJC49_09245 [Aquibium carbonis]
MKGIHSDIVRDRRDGAPWRVTFRKTQDGIGVYNPTRRNIGLVIFMLVWLCGWAMGEWFALAQLFGSGGPFAVDLFLLVWVSFWTLGGLAALAVLAWNLVGVEKLFLIEGGGIVTERGFGAITRRKVFRVDQLSGVELAEQQGRHAANGAFSGGAVRFVADGKPQSFGIGLDDEEADRVVTLMQAFLERHQPERDRATSGARIDRPGDAAPDAAPV